MRLSVRFLREPLYTFVFILPFFSIRNIELTLLHVFVIYALLNSYS